MSATSQKSKPGRGKLGLYWRYFAFRPGSVNDLVEIAESGLFDAEYYVAQYPEVAQQNVDPLLHFFDHGVSRRLNPSKLFDTGFYLDHYPDVAGNGVNPLLHYIRFGRAEGRLAVPKVYPLAAPVLPRPSPAVVAPVAKPAPQPAAKPITPVDKPAPAKPAAQPTKPATQPAKPVPPPAKPAASAAPAAAAADKAAPPRPSGSTKPKLAVIGWDLGHNPVGRSFLVADMIRPNFEVALIGPLFKAYGSELWEPLRDNTMPITSFPANKMGDFLVAAIEVASRVTCEAVIVCKARLPSIILGLLIKHKNNCPMIIDVDDHELSFFSNQEPLTLDDLRGMIGSLSKDDLATPYGQTWSRLSETLIETMDGVIVSNGALRKRFGGTIVRHGRHERRFLPDPSLRKAVRREFGFQPDDKVVLFLGTPRKHKGVFRIAAALDRLKDPRLVMAVIGTIRDQRISNEFKKYPGGRVKFFPDQSFNRLHELINMADAVFLLQDPDDPISKYQSPAKLAEAMATMVPIVTTRVEPLEDVPDHVVHRVNTDDDIDEKLRLLAEGTLSRPRDGQAQRSYFIEELSYLVNGARIRGALADAKAQPPTWHPSWTALFGMLHEQFKINLPACPPAWVEKVAAPRPRLTPGSQFDVAFFWKQNDTGIYGRRHDMMIKYLSKQDRVRRIIQFDAPISIARLDAMVSLNATSRYSHDNLIYTNTVQRFLGLADRGKVLRRTFVYTDRNSAQSLAGQALGPLNGYPQFVKQALDELGNDLPMLAWVCPVIFEFPDIAKQNEFSVVLADLIDDQRTMSGQAEYMRRLAKSYQDTLRLADLVITNCDTNQTAFGSERPDISVVPNAAETFDLRHMPPRPAEFEAFQGPIIGYVGNLRSRIDVDLIFKMATERPDWNIVLIGSAHGSPEPEVFALRRLANVHFLGVRAYDEVPAYIRNFDVAIMPHANNEVSERMNPLKLYVYFALGVPIVTTDVPNIGEVAPYARIATSHAEFIDAVEAALAEARPASIDLGSLLQPMSWERRVSDVMRLLDDSGLTD